jgi:hypothetical protein
MTDFLNVYIINIGAEMIRVKINGEEFRYDKSKEFVIDIFILMLPNIQYQSFKTIKENFNNMMTLAMAASEDKTPLKRRLNKTEKYLKLIKTKEDFIKKFYDFILANEGNGLLTGFGFANTFGNKIIGDPEKQSILKEFNFKEGEMNHG